MTTHLHFLIASYAVFALAIAVEILSLIINRRKALNAVDMDNE
jgi:Heme exporter protein D (CcmD)